MTDNNLDHIHSESVNMDRPPIQGEEIVPEMEVTAEPEATPEPLAEVEATTDTQETAEPPQEASDQEQTAEQKRLARLANDVREKNRKLIEAQAEIERLKAGQPRGFDDKDLEERLAVKEFERATQAIFKTGMDSYGQGFKQELAPLLFRLFHRLHPQGKVPGQGVGLTIVQRLLHRMGGSVEAKSVDGDGSVFTISLPAIPNLPA